MELSNKYYEIIAEIKLYSPERGRHTFITDGYRPTIYFGFSEPNDPHYASDCIIKLINQTKLKPGENATVKIYVIKYFYLRNLLAEKVKLKIKEGGKFIGEGVITGVLGER